MMTFIIETVLKRSDSRSFTEWFRAVNTSGDGMINLEEWLITMSHSNSESVLQSRGVWANTALQNQLRQAKVFLKQGNYF
jgi:alkylated DNA nucleotide flippase Atl1